MKAKSRIAKILMLVIILSLVQVGCGKASKEEVILDRTEQIANYLNQNMIGKEQMGDGEIEKDQITLYGTAVVGRYEYQCFKYTGESEEDNGYSYAVFRKKVTGDYGLEFAQQPSKLIPLAENIMGAYYNDHFVMVSSNEQLARIEITGEIKENVKVSEVPFIHALDIFEKQDEAKEIESFFYDKDGNEIK